MPVDLSAVRKMARDVMQDRDHLSRFDRDLIGRPSARLDVKLQDTASLRNNLAVLRAAIERCEAILSYKTLDERASLMAVRGLLREANQKINAYRRIRPD
jgi:hypothetical protein